MKKIRNLLLALLAAALLSRSSREGHTCLDLGKISGLIPWGEQGEMMLPDGWTWMDESPCVSISCPPCASKSARRTRRWSSSASA